MSQPVRINSLNLCAKAIGFFRQQALTMPAQSDQRFLEWVASILEQSHKFLLPDSGRLMDDVDVIKNADLMRLPYPVTALEYRIGETARQAQPGELTSPNRIALCFSATSPALDSVRDFLSLPVRQDDEGFYVISIFSLPDGTWFPVPLLQFIESKPSVIAAPQASLDYITAGGEHTRQAHAVVNPFYILPYDAGLAGYLDILQREGDEVMARAMMVDALDEVNTARTFAVTINCANIKEEVVTAPKAINEKRARKGKTALQDFHILTIDIFRTTTSTSAKNPGERQSPRQHLRRGHIRRLKNKAIWINDTIVGTGEFYGKNYRVKHKSES